MSALVSPNYLSLNLRSLETSVNNYNLVTFPSRTRITSLSFTVNQEAAGSFEDDRVWQVYALVGVPTPSEGNPWAENTFYLFGANEKPTVTNTNRYVSDTLVNTPVISTIPTQYPMTVSLDLGILLPGSYLAVWVENDGGDIDEIVWEDTAATITIGYEETVALSPAELIAEYPFLD
jgi:hypothetical protein